MKTLRNTRYYIDSKDLLFCRKTRVELKNEDYRQNAFWGHRIPENAHYKSLLSLVFLFTHLCFSLSSVSFVFVCFLRCDPSSSSDVPAASNLLKLVLLGLHNFLEFS